MAMSMPALFTWFLLGICAPVPRDGTSGVTLGDSEWKCASYFLAVLPRVFGVRRLDAAFHRVQAFTLDIQTKAPSSRRTPNSQTAD